MKPLIQILKEYQPAKDVDIQELLATHNLFDLVKTTYELLNVDSHKSESSSNLGCLVSNFITISSDRVSSIQSKSQKKKIEYILVGISEKILEEYLCINSNKFHIVIPQIYEAIRTTCTQCNFDFVPYEQLLNFRVQQILFKYEKEKIKSKRRNKHSVIGRSVVWQDKGKLFELADILKKKRIINRKEDLFILFQTIKPSVIVRINPEKKYFMTYLLSMLFKENFVRMIGNKGYFRYAEDMLTDMEGIPFKRNSLKKISSKIHNDKIKYFHVCKEVDAIINKIS